MKTRISIVNFWLGAALLFAMMFQSFHATEHLVEQFTSEHCDHHYNIGKTEVGHAHPNHDTCFTCEFTFGGFTTTAELQFDLHPFTTPFSERTLFIKETHSVFEGAMFSLRGPPALLLRNIV